MIDASPVPVYSRPSHAKRLRQARALLKKVSKEAADCRSLSMRLVALECASELARQLAELAEHMECHAGRSE